MPENKTKILAIDGGGIRGIIPAMVLTELEKKLKEKYGDEGKSISDVFDFIAGTSTGGLIALGLTAPKDIDVPSSRPKYSASDLVALYVDRGKDIFKTSFWRRLPYIGDFFEAKYPSKYINHFLQEYFVDDNNKELELKNAVKDVMAVAYAIDISQPWFFRSENARKNPDYNFPTWQAARSTSAAPTFFPPASVTATGNPMSYCLVDGGVFANNPSMCALADFIKVKKIKPEDIIFVSLGTGDIRNEKRDIPCKRAKEWGVGGWATKILNLSFHAVATATDYQVEGLIDQYFRFQTYLTETTPSGKKLEAKEAMDDISAENIKILQELGENLIETKQGELDALCALL